MLLLVLDLLSEEIEECISSNKDDIEAINKQASKYINEGYDDSIPLVITDIVYRENNAAVDEVNKRWWSEIKNYSKKDQLSVNYVLWKTDTKYDLCNLSLVNNRYFKTDSKKAE